MKIFTSKTQKVGEKGEQEAVKYLKNQGFSILERNVANKFGEIDVVAKKKGVVYFFEVKAGNKGGSINPAENLTKAKLRKFLISVQHYCFMCNVQSYRAQGIIVVFSTDGTRTVEVLDLF